MAQAADGPNAGFRSDAGAFSRTTTLAYAYADVATSLVWIAIVAVYASPYAFVPGLVTGLAAAILDAGLWLRNGRRTLRLDGQPVSRAFVIWWLAGYFDFLIAFCLGTFAGWLLIEGLFTPTGLTVCAGFWLWYGVLLPSLARLLADWGVGRQRVTAVRRVGGRGPFARLWVALALHGALWATLFEFDLGRSAALFATGIAVAGAMETPLYMLGIREGDQAWKAWLINSLAEWNTAMPPLYVALWALGAVG